MKIADWSESFQNRRMRPGIRRHALAGDAVGLVAQAARVLELQDGLPVVLLYEVLGGVLPQSADEVDFAGFAAAGATLLSPFPGEGRPGVKVGLRARAAQ